MTAQREAMLNSIGFVWSGARTEDTANNKKWTKRYDELVQYKGVFGDCNVPKTWKDNPTLGRWVNHQRQQYKRLKNGEKSYMTAQREAMLNSIRFTWSLQHPDAWTQRYNELVQYKNEHGNCNVPQRFKDNLELGSWVNDQRKQYKRLKIGKKSPMTPQREAMLNSIGFVWSGTHLVDTVYENNWTERYNELVQYKDWHGDCNVPQRFKDNPKLGSWVFRQRQQYKNLKSGKKSHMTAQRIDMLKSIGFTWPTHK